MAVKSSARTLVLQAFFLGAALFVSVADGVRAEESPHIVCLTPMVCEWTGLLLGEALGQKLIVGRVEHAHQPEWLKKTPAYGTYVKPDLERVYRAKPHLVLASAEGTPKDWIKRLRGLDVRVELLPNPKPSQMQDWIRTLATILKVSPGKILDRWNKDWSELPDAAAKNVVLVVSTDPLWVATSDSLYVEALAKIGAGLIAPSSGNGYSKQSVEWLVRKDPDALVVLGMGSGTPQLPERWKSLRAVKRGDVIYLEGDQFARLSFRFLESLRVIHDRLKGQTH
jgi:ABC-type Fe3+-hydroxamate transport system substrate-binding protein